MRRFYCNCLVWALRQWLKHGGRIEHRKSRHGPVPHFIWSQDGQSWWGFAPANPKKGWRVLIHMWWFYGGVVEERRESAPNVA